MADTFLFIINPKAGGRSKHDLNVLIAQHGKAI
jgi:hypothetical protein